MTTNQIEPAFERGTLALNEGKSFADVQKALVGEAPKDLERPEPPPVPEKVVLTDDDKKALRKFADVFAVVQPDERRILTEEEQAAVYAEQQVLKTITKLMGGREEALKTIVRHHMDVLAEAEERADEETQVDAHGHYILAKPGKPERAHIPGTNEDWSREFRTGGLDFDSGKVTALHDNGVITRPAYLAMTREVRVFDPNKALLSATTKPELRAEIFKAIKAMTGFKKPGTSLFTRKAK